MKNHKKISLAIIFLVCIIGVSSSAYALLFATSNITHVDVNYSVALSQTVTDSQVALTATVTNNGAVRAGINVDFYCSIDSGNSWYNFASVPTDSSGVALATYTISANGAYDFMATATIP